MSVKKLRRLQRVEERYLKYKKMKLWIILSFYPENEYILPRAKDYKSPISSKFINTNIVITFLVEYDIHKKQFDISVCTLYVLHCTLNNIDTV